MGLLLLSAYIPGVSDYIIQQVLIDVWHVRHYALPHGIFIILRLETC